MSTRPDDDIGTRAVWTERRQASRRHVNVALGDLAKSASADTLDDLVEPTDTWRPETHRTPQRRRHGKAAKLRHWKTKQWKRRSTIRAARWRHNPANLDD
jgi:hypothetical protein